MKTLSIQRPLPVHGDGDVVVFKHIGELQGGELAALVGIEYFRFPVPAKGIFQGGYAEVGLRVLETRHDSTRREYQSMIGHQIH